MKPDWPTLDVSKLTDDFESWRNGLAYPLQKALTRLRAMTTNQLTIAENMNASTPTFGTKNNPVVHGVEFPFKSSFRPTGFTPLQTTLIDGSPALPIVGEPVINYNRSDKKDGWYGLTVQFAPPRGAVDLLRNAVQAFTANTVTPIQWDTRVATDSGSLSCDITTTSGTPAVNSRVVCAAAGKISFFGNIGLNSVAATQRAGAVIKNNDNSVRWGNWIYEQGGFYGTSFSGEIDVIAGEYVNMYAYSAAAGSQTFGGPAFVTRMSARYIAPPLNYSALVTGILWGG